MRECARTLLGGLMQRTAVVARAASLSAAIVAVPFSLADGLGAGEAAGAQADQETPVPTGDVIEDANQLILAGDAEEAIELLAAYTPLDPTEQAIKRLTLAAAYSHVMDWEAAVAHYVGVVEAPGELSGSTVAAALFGAGQLSLSLGRYEEAVAHLEGWKRQAEEPVAMPHATLSRAYKELGQYPLAIENLDVALRLAEGELAEGTAHDPEMYAEAIERWRAALADLRRLAAESDQEG